MNSFSTEEAKQAGEVFLARLGSQGKRIKDFKLPHKTGGKLVVDIELQNGLGEVQKDNVLKSLQAASEEAGIPVSEISRSSNFIKATYPNIQTSQDVLLYVSAKVGAARGKG